MKRNGIRRLNILMALVALSLGITACTKKSTIVPTDRKIIDMKNFEEDLVVPVELYAEIEKLHKPLAMDPSAGGGEKDEGKKDKKEESGVEKSALKSKPPVEQISLKVYLIEKTNGILGGSNFELAYPIGGGLLDYKTFLQSPDPGYFKLAVEVDKKVSLEDLHVFYLSNAKIRKIGKQSVGNGCGRYFDLTQFWRDSMKSGGVELHTGDNRHLSLTDGIFFFIAPYKGKLLLAHLTIKDSRFKDLECPRKESP